MPFMMTAELFWVFGGHIVRQPPNCPVAFTAAGRELSSANITTAE
jgi:hypothetical protein